MWSKLQSSQQVCLNMTKQASGPPEPNKQTCPNMSAHRLSNMFVKTWLKQASGSPEPKSKARKLVCKLDKTMPVLLHQIAAAATLYSSTRPLQSKPIGPTGRATCQAYASPGPLQSKPIRSHWQSTVSGCLQCIIDRPGLQPLQRRSSFGFQLASQFSQVGRRASA